MRHNRSTGPFAPDALSFGAKSIIQRRLCCLSRISTFLIADLRARQLMRYSRVRETVREHRSISSRHICQQQVWASRSRRLVLRPGVSGKSSLSRTTAYSAVGTFSASGLLCSAPTLVAPRDPRAPGASIATGLQAAHRLHLEAGRYGQGD